MPEAGSAGWCTILPGGSTIMIEKSGMRRINGGFPTTFRNNPEYGKGGEMGYVRYFYSSAFEFDICHLP
jgi:hypothetical protein